MNSNLKFDFTVNKERNSVHVVKTFAASRTLVWKFFTEAALLDQWWAPKPWMSKTKSMDFKEGGSRLYVMVGPNNEEHWALADFTSITPQQNFQCKDAFCDADGNINKEMPRSDWNLDFIDEGNNTTVDIKITHQSLKDLEQNLEMGFKEGFSMTLNSLDGILLTFEK